MQAGTLRLPGYSKSQKARSVEGGAPSPGRLRKRTWNPCWPEYYQTRSRKYSNARRIGGVAVVPPTKSPCAPAPLPWLRRSVSPLHRTNDADLNEGRLEALGHPLVQQQHFLYRVDYSSSLQANEIYPMVRRPTSSTASWRPAATCLFSSVATSRPKMSTSVNRTCAASGATA